MEKIETRTEFLLRVLQYLLAEQRSKPSNYYAGLIWNAFRELDIERQRLQALPEQGC